IDTGGNTAISAGHNITVGNALSLNTEVVTDTIQGANITVSAGPHSGGSLSAGSLLANVTVDHGVTLGTGGNISLTSGGNLTASGGDIALTIHNTSGTINSGGNITVT